MELERYREGVIPLQGEMNKARIFPAGEKDDGVCLRVSNITRVSECRTIYSTSPQQNQSALNESIRSVKNS